MTVSQVRAARNFFDVDNDFTAPLHGFKDAEDYWQKIIVQTIHGRYCRADLDPQYRQ